MKKKLVSAGALVFVILLASCSSQFFKKMTKGGGKDSDSIYIGGKKDEELKATSAVKVTSEVIKDYINTYKDIAMSNMREYKIPASIILAQAILESGSGQGRLARVAKNHFGIKCHMDWTGDSITHDDDVKGECFRKYDKAEKSFEDHAKFITGRSRYLDLFDLEYGDYRGWAYGLKKYGYATDPKYPDKLLSLIKKYSLNKYDLMVLGKEVPVYMNTNLKEGMTSEDGSVYMVAKGDSLNLIANKFGLTLEELKEKNNMEGNMIKPGDLLKIK